MMSGITAIEVENARTHNLQGINCHIPHRKVTVVTGPSGAGKSSLAFDTVFAEGQRRFVESMSTYARQFLQQMERPPVGEIRNLLPAVAIEARNGVRNARSTVGTLSEVTDVLRLLFTHLGETRCPDDGATVRSLTSEEIADQLSRGAVGGQFLLVARLCRPSRRADSALRELVRQGFSRRLEGRDAVRMTSSDGWSKRLDPLLLILGRFRAEPSVRGRLAAAIEDGLGMGDAKIEAHGEKGTRYFSRAFACSCCGREFRRPVPALFSFNSPLGACARCQGFGRVIGVDRGRVIPDPRRSLSQRPIAPWNSPAYEDLYEGLFEACSERGVSLEVPWGDLPSEVQEWIWHGEGDFVNLDRFFRWLEKRSYKVHVRVLLARYRAYDPCPECHGGRLQPEGNLVRLAGKTLPELCRLSVEEFRRWLGEREWSPRELEIASPLLGELEERIAVLHRVGLDYLTLDRQARSLSGGETQRINLAAALGSGLTSTLYVLDEPTIGLHPRDSDRLLALLKSLAERGNTILVVEHDRTLMEGADHVIDLGPAAGEQGGQVIVEGTVRDLLACDDSLTAAYLRQRPSTPARSHVARYRREQGRESLTEEMEARAQFEIVGARVHNLENLSVRFPRQALVVVTGVSGSGKSTLVENVIYANLQRRRGKTDVDPGECDRLGGFDDLSEVILVDQQPLGRSKRSNPVTYVKAYDEVRRLFASVPQARSEGIAAGHFSFNLTKGRCAVCEGTGETEVDMQFMSAVTVICEGCEGRRFRPEVLAIRFRGLNIAETLDLTVEAAIRHFVGNRRLRTRLRQLIEAGLGYLRLGQPTSTLSGGEAQRLKLASFLGAGMEEPRLFLFDEPTTGLHMADIDLLCKTLRRLVRAGHSVVVVEHSPDFIARADWIIDLGPGGGVRGGRLLFSGPVEPFLDQVRGPTADELRRHLRWTRTEPLAAAR
jgi:excinuclease ABC subunit A